MSGGIIIYFNIGDILARERVEPEADDFAEMVPKDFNAFLRIGSDSRVTLLTGKTEIGQGPITSLPQMLAEELDVPYESVDIIMGDTDLCPWDMGTFGSLTTQVFGAYLRDAASEAKGILKELAADYLKCPIVNLLTKDGVLFDKTNPDRKVTYGQLTKGKIIEKHLKDLPPLKPVSEFTVMGKPYLRRDSREKVTGKAKYAGDLRFPNMLYARILRPPAHGAKLKSVDVTEAKKMKDVLVIQDNDLIAVLHRYPDMAEKALTKIKAEFDMPETGLDDNNIFKHLVNMAPEDNITSQAGDLKTGQKLADTIFEETYYNSYVAHAPIEPHTSVATMENDKITIWSATQSPFLARMMVTGAMGLPDEKVRVITPFVGGGFGGKNSNMEAVEAARLAKLTGRTVQVGWSRGEEFFYDSFRPAAVVKIKSGMRNDGKIVFWDYCVYFAGERGSTHCYDIPHNHTVARGEWMEEEGLEKHVPAHPFGVGPWRAPANNTNTYARELHINIMAAKAGMDPVEFRLKNLKDERMIRVLKKLAKEFDWKSSKIPSGRGYGVSCGIDAGTYVAHIAEVDVDKKSGKVKVNRVACAQDMGFVVNPAGAKAQMEGCITMGLGYALTEEIRFKNGEIFDLNFDTYDIPRFSWLPKIETVFVENNDLPPKGGGEPAIVCMGAVIASAIYDATGAVVYQLPMTPERVKKAIERI
jgi:isoquinoline 1-oxidoreductase